MSTNKMFVRYHSDAESVQNAGQNTEVVAESALIVVPVTFNAKYEKDAKGQTVVRMVKDATGKEVEEKVVKIPAKTVKANITAPKFEDITPDVLVALYNDRLESVARSYIKGESEETLLDGAEFSYTISPADLLGERVEISEELFETAKTSFMQYLATQGKTEKAQKNNSLLLGASVTTLVTRDQRFIEAYEANLTKFVEFASRELLMEIEPVITRANRRLERAKNQDIGNLI